MEGKFKFFTFGCWNKNACENISTEKIVGNIKDKNYDFGIILGDNIYPTKNIIADQKIKEYSYNNIIDGFNCLFNLEKPLYFAWGNHDVVDNSLSDLDDSTNVCSQQMSLIEGYYKKNNISFEGNINQFYFIHKNILFFVLDTNILESNPEIFCYGSGLHASKFFETFNWKNSNIKHLVLAGHIPILSLKIKNNKNYVTNSEKFINLIDLLFTLDFGKIYYLCADTHNYQNISLTFAKNNKTLVIEQIICGTGGADLDEIPTNQEIHLLEQESNFGDLSLTNIEIKNYSYSFGYVECEVDGIFKHQFIDINTIQEHSGGFGKLLYPKTKVNYLKLKSNLLSI